MYERSLVPILKRSEKSLLLLGPRQVGKSTLLRSLGPDRIIDLSFPSEFRTYLGRPETLEHELLAAGPDVRTVLIDEVQKVPELLDVAQAFLDREPKRFRFLFSGSSARKLRRGGANLLPGRIHLHFLHPLLASELGDAFRLDRVLAEGSLPGIYSELDADTRATDLRSYVDAYLREEVQAEALVRNLGGYIRLLELVAASSGHILNLNSLCKDAGVGYETARRYLEVLEDTLIVTRIPAWSGSDRAQLISHPKLFLFDLGVRNALLRRPTDRPLEDERGLLLEHLVAYELHRRTTSLWPQARLFHYRTRNGAEVDFVLEIGRELWAIEVKSGERAPETEPSGIRSLADRTTRLKRKIVVFLGSRAQKIGDVECLPLLQFLDQLP